MTNKHRTLSAIVFFLSLCLLPLGEASAFTGRVVDAATGKPVTDAVVTLQNRATRSDAGGIFRIDGTGATLGVRAPGYQRLTVATNRLAAARGEIRLQPFQAKGLYLSIYGIGDRGLRNSAKQLIRDTDLNTLIIDIKGDRGLVPHKPGLPWTTQTGAEKVTTVRDMKEMVDSLHADNIYLIARIVVFKDDLLAQSRPEWAIKNSNGQVWKDKEDLRWIDPFQKEAWRYTIDIAVEAAKLGFDEIQFDYIRFPDTKGLVFSKPNTEEARVEAISGFLTKARLTLIPYNVFLSADIFGYASWNRNDTEIGQRLEDLAPQVDYISPMLYPSCFQFGIPGYRIPTQNPYALVSLSLKNAQKRLGISPARFRPWLQAFRDYGFDRRHFTDKEIREQIRASEEFGAAGWMLWNPRNVYTSAGLKDKRPGRVAENDHGKVL